MKLCPRGRIRTGDVAHSRRLCGSRSLIARKEAGVTLRLRRAFVRGPRSRLYPTRVRPIAPGKAKSSAPLGPELSGGLFFAHGEKKSPAERFLAAIKERSRQPSENPFASCRRRGGRSKSIEPPASATLLHSSWDAACGNKAGPLFERPPSPWGDRAGYRKPY
jgi:hypothetical protein